MAKGSQLNQLKTALNKAGLSQQPQHGKKRKRSVLDDKEKERRAAKLREIQQKMNPFDVKVTKLKHDVGGRKIAGLKGRPAQSKQVGIEQRKKTLLKEYEERDRAGGIVDRRFGENDPSMAPEERMLERFTRERQRASKGDVFNLEDEEELTHYGQSLSKLDDFDNIGLGLEDEDEERGHIDRRTVAKNHFGGFDDDEEDGESESDQPERKKSKAEVMAEVIAKSKEHKYLRQTQQEEDENLRHELDQELDSIRSLLYAAGTSNQDVPSGSGKLEQDVVDSTKKVDDDQEYDRFVRELAHEKRAQPKDRTKTEEEIALEEKEALEKAERRRIRRMNGEEEESGGENEGGKRSKGRRERGGDDLDDDFVEDDTWAGLGAGLGDEGQNLSGSEGEEVDSDEEEVSYEEEDGEEGESESEGEFESSEDEAEGEAGESEELVHVGARSKPKSDLPGTRELPYTFTCPQTHEEFLEIVEDVDDSDIPTVVKRIRALHHPSLAIDNKFKLQALTGVLIDYILYITAPPEPRFTLLSSLIPHLFALTKAYPIQAAEHFSDKLILMQKNLKRGLANGVTEDGSRTWPGLPELSLLRVIGIVWPTSDMNHHIVSPARVLMGAYLALCRIRSLRDIASGLFLSTLFLQFEELSKRLVPEVVNFLINCILHLAPSKFKDTQSLPGTFPSLDFRSPRCKHLALDVSNAKSLTPRPPNLTELLISEDPTEQQKVDLLSTSLDLLLKSAEIYKGLDGFPEMYDPVVCIFEGLRSLPRSLQTKITSVSDTLTRLLKFSKQSRHPLRLQAHKPIPLATYIPKFEHSSSNYLRNRDPDHERNEAAKLRAQYKQERKGAIRELRKDARFLASVQQKKQIEKDREYNSRLKRVYGSIESERAEEKALERQKQKEKRRAGRK